MLRTLVVTFGTSTALHAALLCAPRGTSLVTAGTPNVIEIVLEAAKPSEAVVEDSRSAPATRLRSEPAPRPERRTTPSPIPAEPATPAPALATGDATPHFTIAIGSAPDAFGSVSPSAPPAPARDETDGEPFAEQSVDGKARLVFGLSPGYPADARARSIEGDVRLDLVVDTAGLVESGRVIQGVDPSLDRVALEAAKKLRFDPATRSGRPVRVRMGWLIQFRLQ
jgi:TonB family protein